MSEASQPASQLQENFRCSTSRLRASKCPSRCSTLNHIQSSLESLRRYSIQASHSARPTKVQKGGRSTKKLQSPRSPRWIDKLQDWLIVQPDQQACHKHRSQSDEGAKFSLCATESRRRQLCQKTEITSLALPYENYVGSFLGGTFLGDHFQLQYLQHQEDHLDIYSVTSLSGVSFEAQAFSLSGLSPKALHTRKRRMKRLFQSKKFVCEIQQAGKRFLIIDVKQNDSEWRNLTHKIDRHVTDSMEDDSCLGDFPHLSTISSRRESFSSDSASTLDANSLFSSRPPSSLDSRSSCSSYAEVVSKGLEADKSSKTRKGIRQRQRRQRKRKGGDANPTL